MVCYSNRWMRQQGFHRVGGRWWKVMGWFVFPLRSWEVVLGFTLFGREWREQRFFFWIEHYSASLCRCWNRTNERELDMSMCAGWVFSCSPFFARVFFHGIWWKNMDRWTGPGIQQVSKKRKDLHGSLAPWPFSFTRFLLGSSWWQLLEANHICHVPQKTKLAMRGCHTKGGGCLQKDTFKTGFGGEI